MRNKMDLKSKWGALNALSTLNVCMLKDETFSATFPSVSGTVEIGNGGTLTSVNGRGDAPEKAIDDLWKRLTELSPKEYIVLNAMSRDGRRHVRWNGYMWAELPKVSP